MTDPNSARKLFAASCEFLIAAAVPEQFPPTEAMPEVAFIGRSNVGKSSLINAVTGRTRLARASNTPGRTQQIIFFNLADRLMLVDLPGYGHAQAPKAEVAQWNGLIRHYLKRRANLMCVALLIDGRHGIMANDAEMMAMLDKAAVSYQVVLTKADQIRAKTAAESVAQETTAALVKHPAARPAVILTSAEKGTGICELQETLGAFAAR